MQIEMVSKSHTKRKFFGQTLSAYLELGHIDLAKLRAGVNAHKVGLHSPSSLQTFLSSLDYYASENGMTTQEYIDFMNDMTPTKKERRPIAARSADEKKVQRVKNIAKISNPKTIEDLNNCHISER